MAPCPSPYRSRQSRARAAQKRHPRRHCGHADGHEGLPSDDRDGRPRSQAAGADQQPERRAAAHHPDGSSPGGLTTMHHDSTCQYSYFQPVRLEVPVAYQPDAHGRSQPLTPPSTLSSVVDAQALLESAYVRTGQIPLGHQTHYELTWGLRDNIATQLDHRLNQASRPSSTRAYPGSTGSSSLEHPDWAVASLSADHPIDIERHDSSDSGDGNNPVYRSQYVGACMHQEDPWSTESRRQPPS
ncbi:hypothetical protein SAMD00023353_2001450 [Rosellinia necatrix]|uniref:Uncharacterized protein n=1 Tax=Rosellinia necatrix TaxID=77044 RepID=A0A1W2TEY9_ROSNE|nr:hypothetical protein SAMD00023353_2001450 [Rosellinia necatrix]